jgi:hypothetical protein
MDRKGRQLDRVTIVADIGTRLVRFFDVGPSVARRD